MNKSEYLIGAGILDRYWNSGKPAPIDPIIAERVDFAFLNGGENEEAHQAWLDTAERAIQLVEGLSVTHSTSDERRMTGFYGELAVHALLTIGDKERASTFGQRFMQDPAYPTVSRTRVGIMLASAEPQTT